MSEFEIPAKNVPLFKVQLIAGAGLHLGLTSRAAGLILVLPFFQPLV
jgi:hypothetical protein